MSVDLHKNHIINKKFLGLWVTSMSNEEFIKGYNVGVDFFSLLAIRESKKSCQNWCKCMIENSEYFGFDENGACHMC